MATKYFEPLFFEEKEIRVPIPTQEWNSLNFERVAAGLRPTDKVMHVLGSGSRVFYLKHIFANIYEEALWPFDTQPAMTDFERRYWQWKSWQVPVD